MKIKNQITFILKISILAQLLVGCAWKNNIRREIAINSNPSGAQVSYLMQTGEYKNIGKTPFLVPDDIYAQWRQDGRGYVVLKVSLPGHVPENIFLNIKENYKLDYMAQLNQVDIWNNKELEVSSTAANKLALKVQRINQNVFKKQFEMALSEVEALIEQFPKAHVFYDIKGSIFFLMGRKNEAITSYESSLALQPDNNEARIMLKKVSGVDQ
jgi:tetratricopeptide (TPR) repeat protein